MRIVETVIVSSVVAICAIAVARSQPALPATDCSQQVNEVQVYRNLLIRANDEVVAANAQIKTQNDRITALQKEIDKTKASEATKPVPPVFPQGKKTEAPK